MEFALETSDAYNMDNIIVRYCDQLYYNGFWTGMYVMFYIFLMIYGLQYIRNI